MKKISKSILLSFFVFSSSLIGIGSAYAETKTTSSRTSEIVDEETIKVDALLSTMQKRLSLMHEIAKYKWNNSAPIEDKSAEQDHINKYVQQSKFYGLEPQSVQSLMKGQIDAGKSLQMKDFETWVSEQTDTHSGEIRTAKELLLEMDKLSEKLLIQLKEVLPYSHTTYFETMIKNRAAIMINGEGIDSNVRDTAVMPLFELYPSKLMN